MANVLINLDIRITEIINQIIPHNYFFDVFFSFFSLKGNSIFIWIMIIAFLIIFEGRRDHRFIIYFLASFLITGFLVSFVFKNIFQRYRPVANKRYAKYFQPKLSGLAESCPKDYSFPSGHASTAFAAAATLSYFHKKRKYFFYAVATVIALSRVYLQCHFFLDIVVGAIVGYLIAKTILMTFAKSKKN